MADTTCTASKICKRSCGHTESAALSHSYDNDCDTVCNICNAERTVGEHLNNNGDSLCDHCNAKLPRKGLPAGAIVSIVIGAIIVLGGGGFALFRFVIKKRKWAIL